MLPHIGIDTRVGSCSDARSASSRSAEASLLPWLLSRGLSEISVRSLGPVISVFQFLLELWLLLALQMLQEFASLLDVGLERAPWGGTHLCLFGLFLHHVEQIHHADELLQVLDLLVIDLGSMLAIDNLLVDL